MEERYLFKAKRIDNEEWVIGSLITNVFFRLGQSIPYILCPDKAEYDCFEDFTVFEVQPDTICQCTGLRDRNGNLIWENDIIHKPFYTDYDACANSEAYTGRIQYEDGGWSIEIIKFDGNVCVSPIIDMIAYSKDIEHFEVIGNIFDNPKLLESERIK